MISKTISINPIHRRPLMQRLGLALFPPRCLLCLAPGQPGRDLCQRCAAELPRNDYACRRCAEPLPLVRTWQATPPLCGRCQVQPPAFDRVIAPLLYRPPLSQLVWQLKFRERLAVAPLLAELLLDALPGTALPQALLPVPLHPSRQRERGYNQAVEIAKPVAARLRLPVLNHLVERCRATPAQTGLQLSDRHSSVRGAFRLRSTLTLPTHIALLDDVMTSGSTVNELARTLRAAGVETIDVWVCLRTPAW